MKQSKVFFNDETHLKIETFKLERKAKGINADKIETNSFIIEDYFALIAKIKASIEENNNRVDSYLKDNISNVLEGLI